MRKSKKGQFYDFHLSNSEGGSGTNSLTGQPGKGNLRKLFLGKILNANDGIMLFLWSITANLVMLLRFGATAKSHRFQM